MLSTSHGSLIVFGLGPVEIAMAEDCEVLSRDVVLACQLSSWNPDETEWLSALSLLQEEEQARIKVCVRS